MHHVSTVSAELMKVLKGHSSDSVLRFRKGDLQQRTRYPAYYSVFTSYRMDGRDGRDSHVNDFRTLTSSDSSSKLYDT